MKNGISEADKIVKEARNSMGDLKEDEVERHRQGVMGEVIREEEGKELGPEVDVEGAQTVKDAKEKS